ncbi:MAG: metallophosphoesterase family protein, partial [Nitrospirales bacterium]|nr:metallophosphoesterase family protein [Nitrospirales bacterium]
MSHNITVGVISDTHGLVRTEALEFLQDSDLIIHAGDIGKPEVLDTLRTIAPVYAVRGNIDKEPWAKELPHREVVEIGSHFLYVLHELEHLDLDPGAAQFSAVIFGHSHRPLAEYRKGVLYLNPGSAGPRRFHLPIALARLHVHKTRLIHEIVELK